MPTDSIDTSLSGQEQTWAAMLEAGLLPRHHALSLHTLEDIQTLYREASKGDAILVYRVSREVAEQGASAGLICAEILRGLPEKSWGSVILSFDGWADDPRELFQIPPVVEFCQGLLHGRTDGVDRDQAREVLRILYDEAAHALKNGELVAPDLLHVTGGLWLIGCAFPKEIYTAVGTRWKRDIGVALRIREVLCRV